MFSKQYFNLDINSDTIKSDLNDILLFQHYTFLLRWTDNTEIVLLGLLIEINGKFHSLIAEPISDYDGAIAIPIGNWDTNNFKIHFRIYNPSMNIKIKSKVFVINDTTKKARRTKPAGNKKREMKPRALWQSSL
jgi:hypothetical protein